MFRWGIFAGTVAVVAFAVGIQWGLQGLVFGYAVAMAILILAFAYDSPAAREAKG